MFQKTIVARMFLKSFANGKNALIGLSTTTTYIYHYQTKLKMFPLKKAAALANDIVAILTPYVEVIHVAGSIRRQRPEVKDIELVLIPKTEIIGTQDLFGEGKPQVRIIKPFVEEIKHLGKTEIGSPQGNYIKIMTPKGIKLDIFIPRREDYYRQYCIRTGSKEYVTNNIARGWRKIGWVGVSELGLRREQDCVPITHPGQKTFWKLTATNPELPPAWGSEREFFDWLQVQYLQPHLRNY